MANPTKYYESKTKFENGNVYYNGELYGTEDQFWQDCEDDKILFIEDVSLAEEQNNPEDEHMTRASEDPEDKYYRGHTTYLERDSDHGEDY